MSQPDGLDRQKLEKGSKVHLANQASLSPLPAYCLLRFNHPSLIKADAARGRGGDRPSKRWHGVGQRLIRQQPAARMAQIADPRRMTDPVRTSPAPRRLREIVGTGGGEPFDRRVIGRQIGDYSALRGRQDDFGRHRFSIRHRIGRQTCS